MNDPTAYADDPRPDNPHAAIHPLLRSRWSTRIFDPVHELFDDELTVLFEAARWAPSAGNNQPWAFGVALRDDAPPPAALRAAVAGQPVVGARGVGAAAYDVPAHWRVTTLVAIGQPYGLLPVDPGAR